MSFPQSWLNEPPEIPQENSLPNNQMRQFASTLRKLVREGSVTEIQTEWLFAYEERFTPEHMRVVFVPVTPDAPAPQDPATPPVQLPESIAREVAGVLKEIAASVRELRTGFNEGIKQVASFSEKTLEKMDTNYAGALDKLNDGIEKLNTGQKQLSEGYGQLTDDHRSFLGLIFPHVSDMYRTTNESMGAYRQGLLDTSRAEVKAAQAQAGAETSLDGEVAKALGGLLTDAAREKLGLGPQSQAAKVGAQEAAKEAPKTTEAPKA